MSKIGLRHSLQVSKHRIRCVVSQAIADTPENNIAIPGLKPFLQQNKLSLFLKIIWLIIFVTCSGFLVYQIYDRIHLYFQYPTAVDVVHRAEEFKLPSIVVISSSTPLMTQFWHTYFLKGNLPDPFVTYECINQFLSLVQLHPKGLKMETLWSATNVTTTFEIMTHSPGITVRTEETMSQYGIHTRFKFGSPWSSSLAGKFVRFQFVKPEHKLCPEARYLVGFQEFDDILKFQFLIPKAAGATIKTWFSYYKYIFLNTPRTPCIEDEIFQKCYSSCFQREYVRFECKFPFVTDEVKLPLCPLNDKAYGILGKITETVDSTDPFEDCKCTRKCQYTIYEPIAETHNYLEDNMKMMWDFVLEFHDTEITVLIERLAYDKIAILSDIGGNLGLFLGVSILTFSDSLTVFLRWLKIRVEHRKKNSSDHLFYIKVVGLVTKSKNKYFEMKNSTDIPALNCVLDKRAGKFKKSFWLIFFLGNVAFSAYLIYDRFYFWLDQPTYTTVIVTQDKMVQFPTITICGESLLADKRQELAKKINWPEDCSTIPSWKLVDNSMTAEELWNDQLNIDDSVIIDDLAMYYTGYNQSIQKNRTTVLTPFGMCSEVVFEPFMFMGSTTCFVLQVMPTMQANLCDPGFFWYFLTPFGEPLDLSTINNVPTSAATLLYIRKTKINRANTRLKPCVNDDTYFKCKKLCFSNKYKSLNIQCRLPYMTDESSLPDCNTTKQVTEAQEAYLKIYMRSQPFAHCNCTHRCFEVNYNRRLISDLHEAKIITLVTHSFVTNIVDSITELPAYPGEKLLSDIGSILGLGLGLSVLSLFDLATVVPRYFANYFYRFVTK